MQREDVGDLIDRLEERARASDCWCPNRRAAAALRALLAERDAAFAAGQRDMQERAAEIAQGKHDMALKFMSQYLKDYDGNTDSLIIAKKIRALPIKPRP